MLYFIKRIYRELKLRKVKNSVFSKCIIGINPIITERASVLLTNGSKKEDIIIGNRFKLSGQLISSHRGKIKIGDRSLVGPNCYVGAVQSVTIGNDVWI